MANNRKADILAGKGSVSGKVKEERKLRTRQRSEAHKELMRQMAGSKGKKKTGIHDW